MTQEREAFEAAYSAAYPWTVENTPDCFEQTASGNYEITGVMVGWRMWQARAALAQPAGVPAGRSQLTAVDAAKLSGLMHDAAIRYADGYTVNFDDEASDFLVGAAPQPAQAVPMKGTLNLNDPSVQKRLAAQWGYVQAPAHAPDERDRLRAAQDAAVMPLIGPLLDAWETADREAMDQLPELAKWLKKINRAMESAGDDAAPYGPTERPVVWMTRSNERAPDTHVTWLDDDDLDAAIDAAMKDTKT